VVTAGQHGSGEVSLLAMTGVFLRYRRMIALAAAGGALLGLAIAGLRPTAWVSTTSFVLQAPSGPAVPSQLAALGGSFGINLATADAGSPEFYLEVIRSRPVLARLATDTFRVTRDDRPFVGTIADWLGVDDASPALRADAAMRWLAEDAMWSGVRRGLVEVRVTTGDAALSRQIAERTLAHLGEFSVTRRQTKAAAERRFVERRLEVAREELAGAEAVLQQFLDANRQFSTTSQLRLRQESLERDVTMRQQLVTALTQQYEQARIDEVRNTPVLSVVDEPNLPARPRPRRIPFALAAGLVAGAATASFAAFLLDQSRRRALVAPAPRLAVLPADAAPPPAPPDTHRLIRRS